MRPDPTLKRRYAAKLASRMVELAAGLLTVGIVPRSLGPAAYGDFSFLQPFFDRIVNIFDMGTSQWYYTRLSARPEDKSPLRFYILYSGLTCLSVVGVAGLACLTPLKEAAWPDQKVRFILMAAALSCFVWINGLLNKTADAFGLTAPSELATALLKVIGTAALLTLFHFKALDLNAYFLYQMCLALFLLLIVTRIVTRNERCAGVGRPMRREAARKLAGDLYSYAHPLIVYNFVGAVALIFDRWLLQTFGGSEQQGYFGLAFKLATICSIATGAMAPLITREFSISHERGDLEEMRRLFRRSVPLFYSFAAFFSCFLFVHAGRLHLIFGEEYRNAAPAVRIMAYYPLAQAYGQLSGAVFYASGRTALYRNIGVVSFLTGVGLSFFLLSGPEWHGLGSGAGGLAVKMTVVAFVALNVQLLYNARMLDMPMGPYFLHQIACPAALVVLAAIGDRAAGAVLPASSVPRMVLGGLFYSALALAAVRMRPALFGIGADDIRGWTGEVVSKIKGAARSRLG